MRGRLCPQRDADRRICRALQTVPIAAMTADRPRTSIAAINGPQPTAWPHLIAV